MLKKHLLFQKLQKISRKGVFEMKKLATLLIVLFCLTSYARDTFLESLPDSNGVILINVNRLINEAIPTIVSDDSRKLAEIEQEIQKIKSSTGIDLKQVDQIAVSLNFNNSRNIEALASFKLKFDSSVALETIRNALHGKLREENIGDHRVYIFSAKEVIPKNQSNLIGRVYELIFKNISSDELAISTKNQNTLIIGSVSFVKASLSQKTQIKPSLLKPIKQNQIVAFGGFTPYGLSGLIELEDDEFGKALASVRQINGWIDLYNGKVQLSLNAKTERNQEAEAIKETLSVFQAMFKGILSSMSGQDKQVYAKMLNNLRIGGQNNSVEIALEIPKQDLRVLF